MSTPVVLNGVVYKSKKAAYAAYNVVSSTVDYRIKVPGMLLEETITARPSWRFVEKIYRLICDGWFCVVVCIVCGKTVLLPIDEAKLFRYSDLCDKYEWQSCV